MSPTPTTGNSNPITPNETQTAIIDDTAHNGPQPFISSFSGLSGYPEHPNTGNELSDGGNGVTPTCQTPVNPPEVTLDDDPNSSRRKRQKTGETDGRMSPNYSPVSASIATKPDLESSMTTGTTQNLGQGSSDAVTERETPMRKTLKLNPNGKLLSSPASDNATNETMKKRSSKRGRPAMRKSKHKEHKLVIMKYGKKDGSKDSVGSLIEEITSGRRRHGIQDPPVDSVREEKGPPKPTHPFFLKKLPNAEALPSLNHQDSAPKMEVKNEDSCAAPRKSGLSSLGRSDRPPQPFKRSISKLPEPVDPLWPPKGVLHVRGIETGRSPFSSPGFSEILSWDRKKEKTSTVSINDSENVLLQCIRDTQVGSTEQQFSPTPNASQVLRTPGKRVASGQVLREAVAYELSESATSFASRNGHPEKPLQPATTELLSSMASSMTAFDLGELDAHMWTQTYAPSSADGVLQAGKEVMILRDWLKHLMVSSIETGKSSKDGETMKQKPDKERRKKRRKKADKLDGFIVSSSDEEMEMNEITESEDELAGGVTVPSKQTVVRPVDLASNTNMTVERSRMSNAILISGPLGCGKTASVYAVAKELDFEVFEINAGNRRSAKDIVERVGDMTKNHLVHNGNRSGDISRSLSPGNSLQNVHTAGNTHNKMMSFFKPLSAGNAKTTGSQADQQEPMRKSDIKQPLSQKQSLILLEEADVLFEEDKQFWSGVMTLVEQSKRPIVITCNDESLIPLGDVSLYAILRYRAPPPDLVADYLLSMAANKGHMLQREAVTGLYEASEKDLRRSIMNLNFWCQMGVGSEKSGLDWFLDRWPPGSNVDEQGRPLRMISLNTYEPFMGWFNRDMMLATSPFNREIRLGRESLEWWQLDVQDYEKMSDLAEIESPRSRHEQHAAAITQSGHTLLDMLSHESDYADCRSQLDILCSDCSLDFKEVRFRIVDPFLLLLLLQECH